MGSLFKGKSQTTTSSNQSAPWAPAQDSLKDILSGMGDWYNSAKDTGYISSTGDLGSIYSDYLSGLSGISDSTASGVNNLLNNASTAGNTAQSAYTNAANGGLNYSTSDIANSASNLYNSDLVQKQIDAANSQIDNTLNEQTFTGIDRDATGSGNMGSSRAGVAQAIAARDAATLKANNANTITGNAYNSAINTAANTLSNNTNTQLSGISGLLNSSNSSATQAGSYANSSLSSLAPLLTSSQLNQSITSANQADQIGDRDYLANLLSQYTNIAGTIGGLGGTSSGSQSSPGTSMFNTLLSGGAAAGQIYNAFSDVRLKENVRKVGEENGHSVYEWDWTDEGKRIAGNQPTRGVLAQEVQHYAPDAVQEDPATGYLKVAYSKLI